MTHQQITIIILSIIGSVWAISSIITALKQVALKQVGLWYYRGSKPAWCQGCDQLQPTASMRFTKIGLYRCGLCREEPKLLDQAKNAHTDNWAASLDRWGTTTCQCPACKNTTQKCSQCGKASDLIAGRFPWCNKCYDDLTHRRCIRDDIEAYKIHKPYHTDIHYCPCHKCQNDTPPRSLVKRPALK